MEIVLNGAKRTVPTGVTVACLADELSRPGRRMAVEINEEVIRRSDYETRVLSEGDRVEIVHAVGGG